MRRRVLLRLVVSFLPVFWSLVLICSVDSAPNQNQGKHQAADAGQVFLTFGDKVVEAGKSTRFPRLAPGLAKKMYSAQSGEDLRVIIQFADDRQETEKALRGLTSRREKRTYLIKRLKAQANKSQARITRLLDQRARDGQVRQRRHFWIANAIAVTATRELIAELATHPDVLSICEDTIEHQPPLPQTAPLLDPQSYIVNDRAWGIDQINVQPLWDQGLDGTGVIVASLDTGVDITHPDLAGKMAAIGNGEPGWFDANSGYAFPLDQYGHGTHTLGTVLGGSANSLGLRIGVAPGSRFYAVRIFGPQPAYHSMILYAGQWILDPDGNPETDDAADVVNNSWGSTEPGSQDEWFRQMVNNWRAAGILPIFSAGNEGPDYGTVSAPGNYPESYSVGSTDIQDRVANSSSRGPVEYDGKTYIQPDVAAPGVGVISARAAGTDMYDGQPGYVTGNNIVGTDLYLASGTSMAAPHAAGMAALLLQRHPDWSVDDILAVLTETAAEIEASPLAAGNGRLEAGNIDAAQVVMTPSSIHLGEVADVVGLASRQQVVTARNISALNQTFQLNVDGPAVSGVAYSVTPSAVTLAPGASATALVEVVVDGSAAPFSSDDGLWRGRLTACAGGDFCSRVPVVFARSSGLILNAAGADAVVIHDRQSQGDIYLNPVYGQSWSLAPGMYDVLVKWLVDGENYVVVFEGVEVAADGKTAIDADPAMADHVLTFDPLDKNGLGIAGAPRSEVYLLRHEVFPTGLTLSFEGTTSAHPLHINTVSAHYQLHHDAWYLAQGEFYSTSQHLLAGIDRNYTLRDNPAEFVPVPLAFHLNAAELSAVEGAAPVLAYFWCGLKEMSPDLIEQFYIKPDPERQSYKQPTVYANAGICGGYASHEILRAPVIKTAPDGELFVAQTMSGVEPEPLPSYAVRAGEAVELGLGPDHARLRPFVDPATNRLALARDGDLGLAGLVSPQLGSRRFVPLKDGSEDPAERFVRLSLWDQYNRLVASRTVGDWDSPVLATPGEYLLAAELDTFWLNGHPGQTRVSYSFDSAAADSNPPYMQGFRVLLDGRVTDTIPAGVGAAEIEAAVADAEGGTSSVVLIRHAADLVWSPLTVTDVNGGLSAPLSGLAVPGEYGLKVQTTDAAGNQMTQTFEPAFVFGDPGENQAPVLSAVDEQVIWEEKPLSFSLAGTDPDHDPLAYGGVLANGQDLESVGASLTPGGVFEWTPERYRGRQGYLFDFSVTDGIHFGGRQGCLIRVEIFGDFDQDGDVDDDDASHMDFCRDNPSLCPEADFDQDGLVDASDIQRFEDNYGRQPGDLPAARIMVRDVSFSEQGGNQDGYLDPGETVALAVEIRGEFVDPAPVTAVLTSADPYVDIVQGTSDFSGQLIGDGEVINNQSSPFVLTIDPACPSGHAVDLHFAGVSGTVAFQHDQALAVGAVWPFDLQGKRLRGSPVAGDLNGDGEVEVVIATMDDGTFVLNRHAKIIAQNAYASAPLATAALVDANGDGKDDMLIAGNSGFYAVDLAGNRLWAGVQGQAYPVLVTDLDQDGGQDVIVGGGSDILRAYTAEGQQRWAFDLGWHRGAAAADLGGDGRPEVVVTGDKSVFCLSPSGGLLWQRALPGYGPLSPVIADLQQDGEAEIVLATYSPGAVVVLDHNGQIFWQYPLAADVLYSNPAVADLNGDGRLEIIFGTDDHKLYCLDAAGHLLWTFVTAGKVRSAPVVGDINGDGAPEILFGSEDKRLYCLDASGGLRWSRLTGGAVYHPALMDLDGDQQWEVLFGSGDGKVYCLDKNGDDFVAGAGKPADPFPWPQFQQNAQRTGAYGVPGPVSPGVVIDNQDPGFTRSGTWLVSSATPGYYGANYLAAAKGTAGVARYTFSGLSAGTYRLSAQWSAFENRASNAAYVFKVNGAVVGTQVFNQQVNGGVMNAFDTSYAVPAGATVEVELSAAAANGYVIADAVRLVQEAAAVGYEQTTDNESSAGFTRSGTWLVSSATPGYYGANYLAAAKGTAGVARYTFSGLSAGTYRLSAQWSAFENRASNAAYVVKVNGAVVGTQVFNQQVNGGVMNAFDTSYAVPAGATVEVELSAAAANGYVIADAVRLVQEAAAVGYEQTTDNESSTGFTRSGTWLVSSATPGYYGANYLAAAKGTAGVARYTFSGLSAGTYRLAAQWSAFENRASNAAYVVKVNGAVVGTQVFNQQVNGGVMNAFDVSYAVPAGATVEVELSAAAANGYVIADAVRLVQEAAAVGYEQTTDNESSTGFTRSGTWLVSSATPGYYGANYLAAAKGTAGVARYTFSGLSAGTYRLSAQWSAFENRASNAAYVVKVNGAVVGTQVFNQQVNGGVMNAFDTSYAVPAGATVEVELSAAAANGYVIADAVRLQGR